MCKYIKEESLFASKQQPVGFRLSTRAKLKHLSYPTAGPFLVGSCAAQAANDNDGNQNIGTNAVNSDDSANEDTTWEAVCLSCFPGSSSGTRGRGPDILLQRFPRWSPGCPERPSSTPASC